MKDFVVKNYKRIFLITLSAFLNAVSLQVFVNAGNLFPGGFSGFSFLISRTFDTYFNIKISFSMLYWLLNIPLFLLVFKHIGKNFTILSMYHVIMVSIFTEILPQIPITDDPLLISVFGGILTGFALSIALKAGASSGGTDFISTYLSFKRNQSSFNFNFYFSAAVLIVAGILFGYNSALYSIIYQFCDTQIINLRHNRFKLSTLLIVTEKPLEVKENIFKTVRHGITVFKAEGGFKGEEETVLYMTVNDFQVDMIVRAILQTDPKAFINISKTERVVGNYYQLPLD